MVKCPSCAASDWKRGEVPVERTLGGRTFKADVPADICTSCGETLVSSEDLGRFESAVAAELARAGASSGDALKFMRKEIPLSAVAMAELVDVAPETLSRWETGERDAPRAYVATLGALVLDAQGSSVTLDRLKALRERPSLAKVVRVELPPSAARR
jgi:putative zinc finger/helix-turn-helix YgiT family protein